MTSAARPLRLLQNRWLRAVIGLTIIGVAFAWGLPRFASYSEVGDQLAGVDPRLLLPLLMVAAANLLAPAPSQVAALPGLRFRHAVVTDWATTAVTNLVVGGSAIAIGLTWSMYRSFGNTTSAIARSVVVTGVWDNFVKLGTPLVALTWLATQRPIGPGLLQAAVFGAALFVMALALGVVVLSGPGPAGVLGRWLDRLPVIGRTDDGPAWSGRLDELRKSTVSLLAGRWRSLTFWTVAGHANVYLLLVVCLRAVGVERSLLGWAPVLAAFAFGRLVTAVPLTPGGLGVMEVSLVGALRAVGPTDLPTPDAEIVAAVLLFRFFTLAAPIPFGIASWLWWQARRRSDAPDQPAANATMV